MNDPKIFEEDELDEEDELSLESQEPKEGSSILRRVIVSTVAAFLILTLLHISGIREFFLYSRTPADLEQQRLGSALSAEVLSVPLTIFLIQNDELGSERSPEDIERLVHNAARVWEQADIELLVHEIVTLNLSDEEMDGFLSNPGAIILFSNSRELENKNVRAISVFLLRSLGGINGIAFPGIQAVAVADYTTVYDFRALAHEIGHILGLSHVDGSRGQLMYRGANGIELSIAEIMKAREGASVNFAEGL